MIRGLLGLIILVLDIFALVDLWKSGKDSTKKILWTIGILILPLLGMVLYFLVGKKK